ncbi:MAG: hypothetical protein NC092_10600 [Butyrivibrio sp.]|nr:hypothetical protein [Muribaculum sp.]MCM1553129.1 hypothetical protein [Butyrivibrio sp.]
MTDSEKLDLLLSKVDTLGSKVDTLESKVDTLESKVDTLENEMQDIKKDVNGIKRQVMKSTAELKAMDEMILDEVERVHNIIDKHKEDKTVHTA